MKPEEDAYGQEMWARARGTGWKVKEFINSGGLQYIAIIEKVS